MTVSNPTVKNTYAGNGSTTVFPFTFDLNVDDGAHVGVYVTDSEGYSQRVTNFSIDTSTKKVTYPTSGSPLPSGKKISIRRELPNVQDLNLVNLGEFFAEDIEDEYDYVVMLIQQLAEICSRAITTDMASDVTPVQLLQEIRENLAGAITAKNEAQASANAAAASATTASQKATAAANSATDAANSATTTAGYKASVESTVNAFNATVQSAVDSAVATATQNATTLLNNAVATATQQAGNYASAAAGSANTANNYKNATADLLAATQNVATNYSQQGQSILASAAQYAAQAAQDAAGIHASAIPAWDADTVYSYPDVVAYTDGGTYRCIGEDVEAGTLPTDRDNWVLIAAVNGDDFFEIDLWGGLQPREYPSYSSSWELDENDNITTKGA